MIMYHTGMGVDDDEKPQMDLGLGATPPREPNQETGDLGLED